MTRFAILADVHANLPALEAALSAVRRLAVDRLLFLGDAIAIGPHPAECLDLLLSQDNLTAVLGNHDAYLANGLPRSQPEYMSDGEVEHQLWTHARISPAQRGAVGRWLFETTLEADSVRLYLSHYALTANRRDFLWLGPTPAAGRFDAAYGEAARTADVCLFGHDHDTQDVLGIARYINPGALGCGPAAVARFTLLDCVGGTIDLKHISVPYDDKALLADYDRLRVPERAFLRQRFHGGR